MRVFKATGLRYRINIVSGGEGVYILSGVTEKRQESEINTIVWVFQLLLAGIEALCKPNNGHRCTHKVRVYMGNLRYIFKGNWIPYTKQSYELRFPHLEAKKTLDFPFDFALGCPLIQIDLYKKAVFDTQESR